MSNPTLHLFYDYNPDGSERPVWLGIDIDVIPWQQSTLYIDVQSVYKKDIYDFHDDIIGCSVYLDELLLSSYFPNQLGINLSSIQERLLTQGMDSHLIKRLIVQVCDVKNILMIGEVMFE